MSRVKNLLLTRPKAQSDALAQSIRDNYPDTAQVIISPLLEISHLDITVDPAAYQALIFTSANGVQSVANSLCGSNILAICVGNRTATAASNAGMRVLCANGNADDLIKTVINNIDPKAGPLLHIRGEHSTGDIAARLCTHGYTANKAITYRQKSIPVTYKASQALSENSLDAIAIYSPRTARLLLAEFDQNPAWARQQITLLCISKNVADVFADAGFSKVKRAQAPTGEKMLQLIGEYLADTR